MQGLAYEKHCHKGPKPPLKMIHFYTFTIFTLDTQLDLPVKSTRENFLKQPMGTFYKKQLIQANFKATENEHKQI